MQVVSAGILQKVGPQAHIVFIGYWTDVPLDLIFNTAFNSGSTFNLGSVVGFFTLNSIHMVVFSILFAFVYPQILLRNFHSVLLSLKVIFHCHSEIQDLNIVQTDLYVQPDFVSIGLCH